ncbi:MAG: thioesterase family protein [Pseudomonadota bacterium]
MQFDEIRVSAAQGSDFVIPESWCQGRTVYGGLSAALLCDAVSKGIGQDRRLRYLNISFLKPLEANKPFRLNMEEVSAGRTVTVRSGQIVQDGVTRVAAQANFVAKLDSQFEVETFTPPSLKSWDAEGVKGIRGSNVPAYTQFIDFRFATEGLPFQGTGVTELGGWMRFNEAPETMSECHLVCLIDAWPPVPVSYYERVVPLSTINWEIVFVESVDGVDGNQFLGYMARLNFFRDGYGSSTADIWTPDGRCLAKSQQTFVIYG